MLPPAGDYLGALRIKRMTTRSILLFLCALIAVPAPAPAGALSNRRAPSFTLPDSALRYHDILDYRGKVLLIDIMRTDCPHCQELAPVLEALKKKYGERIAVLSIVNNPDNQKTVADFVARFKVTTPILFDCGYTTMAYMKSGNFGLPHLFIVDPQGQIREDWEFTDAIKSQFTVGALSPIIDRLLTPAAVPPAKKK